MRDNDYDNQQEEILSESQLDPRVQEVIKLLEEAVLPLSEQPSQAAPIIDGENEMENEPFPLFEEMDIDEVDEAVLDSTWAALRAEYNQNPAAFLAEFEEDLERLPQV
jgi:uncharacterized protein with von Willebrand factor type A (vWA) domain